MGKTRVGEKAGLLASKDDVTTSYSSVDEKRPGSPQGGNGSHADVHREQRRQSEIRVLYCALIFCFVFMVTEFAFGVFAHSLALLTDAAHLLIDVGSYGMSILSLKAASKALCGKYNYGWHRAEVIGTLISVFSIWVLVAWIVVEGVTRIFEILECSRMAGDVMKYASSEERYKNLLCKEIDSRLILVVGVLGIMVNAVCALILYYGGSHGHSHFGAHGHSHNTGVADDDEKCDDDFDFSSHDQAQSHGGHSHSHDHAQSHGGHSHGDESKKGRQSKGFAVHAALLHALGDFVQSIGVILAGAFIYIANKYTFGVPTSRYSIYNLADPICSLFFGVITLYMTKSLFGELFGILMESTPPAVDYRHLREELLKINGVVSVHDLHVWSLSSDYIAFSVHLVADDAERVTCETQNICKSKFGISHTTIQVDKVETGSGRCEAVCASSEEM